MQAECFLTEQKELRKGKYFLNRLSDSFSVEIEYKLNISLNWFL